MLDSCALLMEEFDCTVVLVHHTGVSEDAQHRARGSSAWRGALDIEVSVKPGKNGGPIEVIQRKMKDAEMQDSMFFDLKKVDIRGWRDEDGDQVSSVVLESTNKPMSATKVVSKVEEHRKRFERAWHFAGRARDPQGRPHVTRSGMLDFLTGPAMMMKEAAAKKAMQMDSNRMIGTLVDAEYVTPFGQGWSVTDNTFVAVLDTQVNS
jgi:hypothetical protein